MSFVSRGEKKMHNMAKKGSKPGMRGPQSDGFGKKGDGDRKGAPRNTAPGSKDREKYPVSEDAENGMGYEEKASQSEYDPASGKRAKSVADLRSALKKINERSDADGSPTGSEGGQDGKHSNSKNESGFMKGAGYSEMDKKSRMKPRAQAPQDADADDMEDPMDEDEENSGQTQEGMTPKGKKRNKALKAYMKMAKSTL